MEQEKTNAAIMVSIVIVAVVVLGYLFIRPYWSSQKNLEGVDNVPSWTEAPATTSSSLPSEKIIITAKHQWKAGSHTIAGEVVVPSPCHLLESSSSASADGTKAFLEIRASIAPGESCSQTPTPLRFKVTQKGDKNTAWSATYNGMAATLNLIEAGPNEDLSNFELFIKG